jgi:FAD/FMN-containing dehydrogenase
MSAAVLEPGSDVYEAFRRPAMPRFADVRPAAIVRCASAADVAEALAYARAQHVAVRSGGHCFAGRSSTDGVVIDVGPMHGVRVDGDVVHVGAGARLADVYDALYERGGAIAGGCGPDVGIAGLLLGGGLGVLGRMHGLTCDQLLAAEVVLGDGRVVRCDADTERDLFWALRGAGGGQFGVVTEFTLRVVEGPASTVFHLRWPRSRAADLIARWQAWAPDAPDELAASLLCTPGGVHLFGLAAGVDPDLDVLPEPDSATVEQLPWRAAKAWLALHGPGEGPPRALDYARSEFFSEPLPNEAVDALVAGFEDAAGRGISCELDFSPWGGAYNRVPVHATAFPHRAERFLLKQAVYVPAGEDPGPAREWLDASWAAVHPCGSGGVYPNFPDHELDDPLRAYHGANLERLREVKATYDPERVFTFPQSL